MAEPKPQSITGYDQGTTATIFSTCLHLATRLGDFKDDLVVIGGMVPYFLVEQTDRAYEQRHCGSLDHDLALSVSLLNEERYEAIAARLFSAGFQPETNKDGNRILQRWRHIDHPRAVVDFLMDIAGAPGKLQHLTRDLAAFIMPGVSLAFDIKQLVWLSGKTLDGADAEREIYVCGPGAFVILKGMAFGNRSEPKDAYDIDYILRYCGNGIDEIAESIRKMPANKFIAEGLAKLKSEFESIDRNGPIQLAKFLGQEGNDDLRADCSGLVMEFVRLCREP